MGSRKNSAKHYGYSLTHWQRVAAAIVARISGRAAEGWRLYTDGAILLRAGSQLLRQCRGCQPFLFVMVQGIAVDEPKQWCSICNQPDTDDAPCRRDYPTQEQLIDLLRKIYAEEPTPERIKRMIEDAFR